MSEVERQLSIFPLSVIVFPGGLLPLRIFETRYLDMVSRCLKHDGRFGMCLLRGGREASALSDPFETGVCCRIVDFDRLRDGTLGITVRGESRFRTRERWQQPDRLWVGRVHMLDEAPPATVPEQFDGLAQLAVTLMDQADGPFIHEEHRPQDAAWVGGRLVELLPLTVEVRQRLLEITDPISRLRELSAMLRLRQD